MNGAHLAIDAVGAKHSGAATVLLDILRAAIEHPAIERVTVFTSPRDERSFDLPASPRLVERPQANAERGAASRLWWLWHGLPAATKRESPTALLCLAGAGAATAGVRLIPFVQQSLPFSREALARCGVGTRLRMAVIRGAMGSACRAAARVIVQTPTMKAWVANAFGLAPEQIEVILPGPPELAPPHDSPRLEAMHRAPPGTRVLYVGNASPYKNVPVLFRSLPALAGKASLFLTWPQASVPAPAVGLGPLTPAELHAAYRLADVLVQPSLVETVGLPMLEAMACGVPVVAADRPYAHDVCGGAALYFDPASPEEAADRMLTALVDAEVRRRLTREAWERLAQLRSSRPYARVVETAIGRGAEPTP